ncbi:MAG: phosphoglycerate mutase [Ramlibacter sp.]
MSDSVNLLIPFAHALSDGCAQALRGLALPNLEKLLARLSPGERDAGDEWTLSMPHERVLARAAGLPAADGLIPWAAWQVKQAGRDPGDQAWARITPCHWRVGRDHVAMDHPQQLQLDAAASQALLAAMQPYFEQDGITLEYDTPTQWLAHGEIFRELPVASLDRVVGRTIDPWMPRTAQAGTVRRLQQEMQMLLYTHEVNEERTRGGLLPVNSFWVSGTGALPASGGALPAGLLITHDLRDAALREDWRAWAAAWQQLDAQECTRLYSELDRGQSVTLTLCGERAAQMWNGDSSGSIARRVGAAFGSLWTRTKASSVLETL